MHTTLAEIAARIDADRETLHRVSRDLTQTQLDFRPSPEAWSVGENLDHLALTERGVTRLLHKKIDEVVATGSHAAPELPSQLGSLDRFPILDRTNYRRKAPDIVAPRHGVPADELRRNLDQVRDTLRKALDALALYDLTPHTFPHPFLGALNLYQWILFVGQHEQRHLEQINTVLTDPNFPRESANGSAA